MNSHKIHSSHPNYQEILVTKDSLNYISGRIQKINNNLTNFKWILITLFVGIIFSFSLSFRNNPTYWISLGLFIVFGIIIFYVYATEHKKRKADIKELEKERQETIGHLYILGFFNKEHLENYRSISKISESYYQYLLSIPEDKIGGQVKK